MKPLVAKRIELTKLVQSVLGVTVLLLCLSPAACRVRRGGDAARHAFATGSAEALDGPWRNRVCCPPSGGVLCVVEACLWPFSVAKARTLRLCGGSVMCVRVMR